MKRQGSGLLPPRACGGRGTQVAGGGQRGTAGESHQRAPGPFSGSGRASESWETLGSRRQDSEPLEGMRACLAPCSLLPSPRGDFWGSARVMRAGCPLSKSQVYHFLCDHNKPPNLYYYYYWLFIYKMDFILLSTFRFIENTKSSTHAPPPPFPAPPPEGQFC